MPSAEVLPFGNMYPYSKPGSANDPVANAARQAADHVIKHLKALPAESRGAVAKEFARGVRSPDGDAWLARQIEKSLRAGASSGEALRASIAALMANSFSAAFVTGKLPSWWQYGGHGGFGALGGVLDTIWDGLKSINKALICTNGTGAISGAIVGGFVGKNPQAAAGGGAIGATGQDMLQNVVSCENKQPSTVQTGIVVQPPPEPWYHSTWFLIGGGVVLAAAAGGGIYAYSKRKKRGRTVRRVARATA